MHGQNGEKVRAEGLGWILSGAGGLGGSWEVSSCLQGGMRPAYDPSPSPPHPSLGPAQVQQSLVLPLRYDNSSGEP